MIQTINLIINHYCMSGYTALFLLDIMCHSSKLPYSYTSINYDYSFGRSHINEYE